LESPTQAPALDATPPSAGDQSEGTDPDQGDPLAKLAAALLTLSPADRARLAAMLTGHQGGSEISQLILAKSEG
jgi:hypothetical protein